MNAAADSNPVRFSSHDLPERDRLAVWREAFARQIIHVEWEPLPGIPFFQTSTFRKMPGLSLAFGASSGFCARRTAPLVGDGNDDLLLTINLRGRTSASQFGREAEVGPSSGFLMSAADVSTVRYPDAAQWIVIGVPRKTIAAMVKEPESVIGRTLGNPAAIQLLTNYVLAVNGDLDLSTPKLWHVFRTHVHDLVALAIGATRDGVELARSRGLRAARLAAIKADTIAHLS
ncbi:MAG: hypothetical protein ABUL53_06975, partial [Bradyrhizobium guangdongense]